MKAYPVKFEVRESPDGWRLFALPCHNVGWAPIPMTSPRGTPSGALAEFASALYDQRLTVDGGVCRISNERQSQANRKERRTLVTVWADARHARAIDE